VAPNLKFLY